MTLLGCEGPNGARMGTYCHRKRGDFLHLLKRYPMTCYVFTNGDLLHNPLFQMSHCVTTAIV